MGRKPNYPRRFFEDLETIERMVSFAYSPKGFFLDKKRVGEIAEGILERKNGRNIDRLLHKYTNPELYLEQKKPPYEKINRILSFAYSPQGSGLEKNLVWEIAGGLLDGKSHSLIASELGVNPDTVYRYTHPDAYLKEKERRRNRQVEKYRSDPEHREKRSIANKKYQRKKKELP
ncbi:MAG: hypothetical protein JW727_03250 [Candidatus Aenigmarchaeota archaeon]|nr:hypothetical protein [Candidatus Aenigmarchaeota archaeon]